MGSLSLSFSMGKGGDITVSTVLNLHLLVHDPTTISRGGAAFPLLHPMCNILRQVIPPKCTEITSHRLLEPSQAAVYRGKRHTPPPHFGPLWAYLRTLPQGVELLVYPLVNSLFCPINTSPNEFLVRDPP